MFDFESRSIIESLRSGVPSISVGKYFSQARPAIMRTITCQIDDVSNKTSLISLVLYKDVFISFEPKFSGKCKKENGNLRLTEEGACIISYGFKEEYFIIEKCGKDFCVVK